MNHNIRSPPRMVTLNKNIPQPSPVLLLYRTGEPLTGLPDPAEPLLRGLSIGGPGGVRVSRAGVSRERRVSVVPPAGGMMSGVRWTMGRGEVNSSGGMSLIGLMMAG